MSDYGDGRHPKFTSSLTEASHRWTMEKAAHESASASSSTRDLTEQLVQAAIEGEQRELKMLFWARIAAVAGIVAVLATIAGIVIALMAHR